MYVRKNVMSFLFLVATQSTAEDNNILLTYFPCVSPNNNRHVASIGGGGGHSCVYKLKLQVYPPPRIRIFWVSLTPHPHPPFKNDVTYLYVITSMLSCLLYVTVQTWKLSNISDIVRVVLALKTAQHST